MLFLSNKKNHKVPNAYIISNSSLFLLDLYSYLINPASSIQILPADKNTLVIPPSKLHMQGALLFK